MIPTSCQSLRNTTLAILCASVGFQTLKAAEEECTDFVRVARPESGATFLQTAITRYSKGEQSVDLVGAVHIGDLSYYQELDEHLSSYPVVLFELIGGEALALEKEAIEAEFGGSENQTEAQSSSLTDELEPESDPSPSLIALSAITHSMQHKLGLESQLLHIDYYADNFIHADLTIEEFDELQKEDGNSLSAFMLKQAFQGTDSYQPSTLGFLIALLSNNPNRLKLQIIDTLGDADQQLASLDEENLIITQRNQRCFEVLDQTLESKKEPIAIFYGAAHFPHMEKLLLDRGYILEDQQWLNAWSIPAAGQKPATAEKPKNDTPPEP